MPLEYTPKEVARFWSRVRKSDECWIWTAGKTRAGYGQIYNAQAKHSIYAHRMSFEIHFGAIPDGTETLHSCDNPSCIRPDHLFAMPHAKNVQDMFQKHRRKSWPSRGERHPSSKLTYEAITDIRAHCGHGRGHNGPQFFADKYHVSRRAIRNVLDGKSWRA